MPIPAAFVILTVSTLLAGSPRDPEYCTVESEGAALELVRPAPSEPPIDDVNWFARPLANDRGRWMWPSRATTATICTIFPRDGASGFLIGPTPWGPPTAVT